MSTRKLVHCCLKANPLEYEIRKGKLVMCYVNLFYLYLFVIMFRVCYLNVCYLFNSPNLGFVLKILNLT